MIEFDGVSKRFGDGAAVVDDLTLTVQPGAITVFVGPSGCGKTTSLRMINRLEEPSAGTIRLDGRDIMTIPRTTLRRGIGYVMQSSGLFPHRTVRDNVATVPHLLGWDRARIEARVRELVDLVGLRPEILPRYPHALSGGQQQRVGVARALAADPPVLLMDEPFAAVDPVVRAHLQDELLALQARVGKTIVFVTHDIDEAIKLGDRIAVLRDGGRLAQEATPTELLAAPANDFVADFLGGERELRRLALIPVARLAAVPGPVVAPGDTPAAARAAAAEWGWSCVIVVDGDGRLLGWLPLAALAGERVDAAAAQPFPYILAADASLRSALNATIASPSGLAPCVDGDGRYQGVLTRAMLGASLA